MDDEPIFRRSAAGAPLGVVLAAALLVAAPLLGDPFARWMAAFLGAGLLGVSLARLVARREFLRLHADGVDFDTLFYVTRLRWAHVETFRIDRLGENKVIRVKCQGRFWGRKPFALSEATWVEGGYFIPNVFEAPLEEIIERLEEGLAAWRTLQGDA
ncbi:hypothetical protein [Pseudazoarcus pumilus]|uniref:DUF304 domain-containing protein n=1 Tax=Pseudazoarcus pumilus TaxID=2067960 RepID=A0A2I6S9P3_9RHOO|nr:hypothetical protein [Pseudazoarcus pumilus]AUN95964.1 hypothetical protein C0099_14075 [Pseudazoarcus pumilus]